MSKKIKTGEGNLMHYLGTGGIKGKRFLDRKIGKTGAVYKVFDLFPEKSRVEYVEGPRLETTNISMRIYYEGNPHDMIDTRVCNHLNDLEVLG